jgi:hypothetical protein
MRLVVTLLTHRSPCGLHPVVNASILLEAGRELRLYRIVAAGEPMETDFVSTSARHIADLAASAAPAATPGQPNLYHSGLPSASSKVSKSP